MGTEKLDGILLQLLGGKKWYVKGLMTRKSIYIYQHHDQQFYDGLVF